MLGTGAGAGPPSDQEKEKPSGQAEMPGERCGAATILPGVSGHSGHRKDSPMTFKADGHTVHDFDQRFQLEDDGLICPNDKRFRWSMLNEELNYRLF